MWSGILYQRSRHLSLCLSGRVHAAAQREYVHIIHLHLEKNKTIGFFFFNGIIVFAEECVDMRKDNCFLNYTNGQCSVPMSNSQTRMICCCSMGQAWGLPCQPCPALSTSEFKL